MLCTRSPFLWPEPYVDTAQIRYVYGQIKDVNIYFPNIKAALNGWSKLLTFYVISLMLFIYH